MLCTNLYILISIYLLIGRNASIIERNERDEQRKKNFIFFSFNDLIKTMNILVACKSFFKVKKGKLN